MKKMLKQVRYAGEALALLLLLLMFRAMPLDWASALGGRIAGRVGPLLRAHRTARRNLEHVFPAMGEQARRKLLAGMWENLGRTAGELAFMSTPKMRGRVTVEGAENMKSALDSGGIFIGGHFANWELLPLIGVMYNMPVFYVYRQANNPYAERVIQFFRSSYRDRMLGKGRDNLRHIFKLLQEKKCIGMMVDQKLGEGSLLPFMGHPARTATAPAKLAMRIGVPLLCMQAVRTHGAHFHVTISPPQFVAPDADPDQVMRGINAQYEQWIGEHPEQWFWVHNRWSFSR